MTVNSDGTVTSSGNIALETPTVTTNLILTLENGSTFEVGYSDDTALTLPKSCPQHG